MGKILLFDWGNTIMVDFNLPGPMYLWESVAWVPGAEECLRMLSSYTCCIATNAGKSDSETVRKGLARVGADLYFSHIFSSIDIGFEKPDPRFFGFILQTLQAEPGNCIMIGDNYKKDIAGAKAMGIKTVFFNHTFGRGSFPDADATIYGMNELTSIISRL
jgi:putative hydrolase of the HAD superfamily